METYKLVCFFIPSILFVCSLFVLTNESAESRESKNFKHITRFFLLVTAVPTLCALIGILLASPISKFQDQNNMGLIWSGGATTLLTGGILGMLVGFGICFYILSKTKFPR